MNKRNVFYNFGWRFAERISSQLVSLIVSVVLARILLPEQYGMIVIVSIFIQVANVFLSFGLGTALVQKKDVTDLDYSTIFYINLGMSIVLYLILYLLAPFVSSNFNNPLLSSVLRVLGLQVILSSYNSIQLAYVSRNMIFKKLFGSTVFAVIISGITGIFMAINGAGVWALVVQSLVNSFIGMVILAAIIDWRPKWLFSWKHAKGMVKYASKLMVAGIISTINVQLRNLLIGKRFSASDLAFFSKGNSYPLMIMGSISSSLNSVLFPVYARYQNDETQVKETLRKSIRLSAYVIMPLMLGLCAVARPLTLLLLTEKWSGSIIYLQLGAISYATWSYQIPTQSVIQAIGRSDSYLKLEIVRTVMVIVVTFIAASFSVKVIALSILVLDMISMVMIGIIQRSLLKYSFREQFIDIIHPIALSTIMFVLVRLTIFSFQSYAIQLLVGVLIGVVFYVITSKLLRNNEMIIIMSLLKKGKGNVE